jgi:hypothetical protein
MLMLAQSAGREPAPKPLDPTLTKAQTAPSPLNDPQFSASRNGQADPEEEKRQREMQKKLNQERFNDLKKDTNRLLELATELKKSVDGASEHTLSLDVIKKTEEVEKLAKKVRDKMKANY